MERIADFFAEIVQAAEKAPLPKNKYALASSLWTDPGPNSPVTLRVDQYMTDLHRFREDAHCAAWITTGVSGIEWETLTFVWNDEANNATQLAEKLERRGYSETDYSSALKNLAQRNWLSEIGGVYKLTKEGQRTREEAENETDRLFYAGWGDLEQDELAEINSLLGELKSLLQEHSASEPVTA